MLFSRCCPIMLCKYNFTHHIAQNDSSLLVFVTVATSNNLGKDMTCDNNDFMPDGNFCKYVKTADKVILSSFLMID